MNNLPKKQKEEAKEDNNYKISIGYPKGSKEVIRDTHIEYA
jgi:hypothetical protein